MIFPYRSVITEAPDGIDFLLVRRPEIPITVIGPSGEAACIGLVDTGSDSTILPMSLAKYLGIAVHPLTGPPARAFGGYRVQLFQSDVRFRLESEEESVNWAGPVCFFDFPAKEEETVILGHSGFLDYFTAIFDGKLGTLTLLPNDELPIVE